MCSRKRGREIFAAPTSATATARRRCWIFIRPHVDAYKVDLKTFDDKHYRQLGGVMENVVATIRMLKERGFWVEIVTLVVPGFSDNADDLKRMADFLASVDPMMPWHMTAFHPDYKMTEGYRRTARRRVAPDRRIRQGCGAQVPVSGESAGPGWRMGEHALSSLQCDVDRAIRFSREIQPHRRGWIVPAMSQRRAGDLGKSIRPRRRARAAAAVNSFAVRHRLKSGDVPQLGGK